MFLSFKTFSQILRFSPSFIDIVSFIDILDDAWNVLCNVLLVEPGGVEIDLVPGDVVDLGGEPDLGAFCYFGLYGLVLMAVCEDVLVDCSGFKVLLVIDEEGLLGVCVFAAVEVF